MDMTEKILSKLTLDEKISLLTGGGSMLTAAPESASLKPKTFVDGPHGIRSHYKDNCTSFPNLCSVGTTWDTKLTHKMGVALAEDCTSTELICCLDPASTSKGIFFAAGILNTYQRILS